MCFIYGSAKAQTANAVVKINDPENSRCGIVDDAVRVGRNCEIVAVLLDTIQRETTVKPTFSIRE